MGRRTITFFLISAFISHWKGLLYGGPSLYSALTLNSLKALLLFPDTLLFLHSLQFAFSNCLLQIKHKKDIHQTKQRTFRRPSGVKTSRGRCLNIMSPPSRNPIKFKSFANRLLLYMLFLVICNDWNPNSRTTSRTNKTNNNWGNYHLFVGGYVLTTTSTTSIQSSRSTRRSTSFFSRRDIKSKTRLQSFSPTNKKTQNNNNDLTLKESDRDILNGISIHTLQKICNTMEVEIGSKSKEELFLSLRENVLEKGVTCFDPDVLLGRKGKDVVVGGGGGGDGNDATFKEGSNPSLGAQPGQQQQQQQQQGK